MIVSFHFPPTAAHAAVSGQFTIVFFRAGMVTSKCVLANTRILDENGARADQVAVKGRWNAAHVPARRRLNAGAFGGLSTGPAPRRKPRLRFRDRDLAYPSSSPPASAHGFDHVGRLRRHLCGYQNLERQSEHGRA